MVTSVASGILINTGHLLENLVFTALRRVTPSIWYCKTKGGLEVDFMVQLQDRSRMLVQVCESMADPQTRKREIAALTEAMVEYDLQSGTIVTRNEDDQIKVGAGEIEIVPAWRFLINLPES
jgi:predicted AAA+ superfamily ATPase